VPFSPVRAPKIRVARRPPASLSALAALENLQERENELAHSNRNRALSGIAIVIISSIALPLVLEWLFQIHRNLRPSFSDRSPDAESLGLILDGFILVGTLPMAIAVGASSRSKLANQFLDSGTRPRGANDNPLMRLALMIIMLGFLYGEFLIVDSIRFGLLRIRLQAVDRHRAALILAKLFTEPAGIDPRTLLALGENPLHLRQILGYLMAYEWADISPRGDWLGAISPSKRELRHAKNALFEVATDTN
jgi:hypothetical protein